jgi:cytochrome c oxidase subunit 1
LPAFGIISEIIKRNSNLGWFGKQSMIWSMITIGIVGFIVWGHHMFTTGFDADTKLYFTFVTLLIAVPTGVKVFCWIGTMWRGVINWRTCTWFAVGFIFLFTFGGLSGVVLANGALNAVFHDSMYVVGHFHYVLSLGAVSGIFAGFYYWESIIFGRTISSFWGRLHFLLFF